MNRLNTSNHLKIRKISNAIYTLKACRLDNLNRLVLIMLVCLIAPSYADETITIGRGSGIVWRGLPFSGSLTGPTEVTTLTNASFITITQNTTGCTTINPYTIGGIRGSRLNNNQVIWRLCSGGSALPTGRVTAADEMLVTYN